MKKIEVILVEDDFVVREKIFSLLKEIQEEQKVKFTIRSAPTLVEFLLNERNTDVVNSTVAIIDLKFPCIPGSDPAGGLGKPVIEFLTRDLKMKMFQIILNTSLGRGVGNKYDLPPGLTIVKKSIRELKKEIERIIKYLPFKVRRYEARGIYLQKPI